LPQKQGFLTQNYFQTIFAKIFASSKNPDISKKFPNFDNRTIPKLVKTKSSENSVFRRALDDLLGRNFKSQVVVITLFIPCILKNQIAIFQKFY
jgi:hypothetical protein